MPVLNSITFLGGHQEVLGDNFTLTFGAPFDNTTQKLTMSLGISFGYQPSYQYSIIKVGGLCGLLAALMRASPAARCFLAAWPM